MTSTPTKSTTTGAPERSSDGADRERPNGALAGISGVYLAGLAGALWLSREELPKRVSPWDVALFGIATHKLSRRIAKDSVTQPIREPFSHVKGSAAPGEVQAEPEGHGLRKAIGELITCPFCVGQWVATAFVVGFVRKPRLARLVATIFTTSAIADFLQFAYAKADQTSKG